MGEDTIRYEAEQAYRHELELMNEECKVCELRSRIKELEQENLDYMKRNEELLRSWRDNKTKLEEELEAKNGMLLTEIQGMHHQLRGLHGVVERNFEMRDRISQLEQENQQLREKCDSCEYGIS